jgi:hypothetical protein
LIVFVCPDCFSDTDLKKRIIAIRPTFPNVRCDFHETKKGITIEAVAEIVDPVFRENFVGGPYDPYYDRDGEHSGTDLGETLRTLTGAEDDRVVNALANALIAADEYWPPRGDDAFYDVDYRYQRDDAALAEHSLLWARFTTSLMHDQRFFNSEARELIARIFSDVHQQRDVHSQGPVYLIEPNKVGSTFIRARIANEPAKRREIEGDLAGKLGLPPERLRMAGRLNPSGVPAFYAAYDTDTCIAELRPSVGEIVVTAEFQIPEPICVLDTTLFGAKPKAHDPFARDARKRAAQWLFMTSFMNEIARPILPGDVHLDYVPTQAVAEYLVRHHKFTFADKERTIDAIIYGSAQHPGGRNIALLGPAAVVGNSTLDDDGQTLKSRREEWFDWLPVETKSKTRIVPTPGSLREHRVAGVTFSSDTLPTVNEIEDED